MDFQNKMWFRKPTHLLFQQKKTETVHKTDKPQTPKGKVPTSKKINLSHLTQYINQGLPQELIYLIKVTENKTPQK